MSRHRIAFLKQETVRFRSQRHIPKAAELSLRELRPAKTRENMWIGEVAFNGQWLVTFLVFKNKDGFAVKEPKQFVFLDDVLKRRVADLLTQAIEVSK